MGSKDKVVGRLEVPMKAPGVYEGEDDDLDELVEILTGTGLEDECVDYVMLFNILHAEEPLKILGEAYSSN